MDCKELKEKITNKTLGDSLLVIKVDPLMFPDSELLFKGRTDPTSKILRRTDKCSTTEVKFIHEYDTANFLLNQYIQAIGTSKGKSIIKLNGIEEFKNVFNGFEGLEDDCQYVLYLDVLDNLPAPIEDLKNLIIVTAQINCEVDYVELPKLVEWQIIEYAKTIAKGLNETAIKWLCELCDYDLHRIDNELKKLKVFTPVNQEIIFKQLNEEDAYIDLQTEDIFVLVDAIIHKDIKTINSMLAEMPYIDIEGTGLVTMLRKRLLLILAVQLNPYVSAEELGITSGRLYYLKKDCGIYSNNQLRDNLEFLDQIDYKIKSGQLTFETYDSAWMNNMKLVDYILCNVLK